MRPSCGVILAGGAGERYGGPKVHATLPDGRTFLAACHDLLAEGGCAPIVATLPPGAAALPGADLVAVALPTPGLAMFDSLRIALAAALDRPGWEVAVIVPVDHPLVRPDTVRALVAACRSAVIATHAGKHGHPVAIAREVASQIAAGTLGGPTLREALRESAAVDVAVDDPGVRANCNTPEALDAAWRRVGTLRGDGR